MQISLEKFDVERVKRIAELTSMQSDCLTEAQVWGIVSHSLIVYKIRMETEAEVITPI